MAIADVPPAPQKSRSGLDTLYRTALLWILIALTVSALTLMAALGYQMKTNGLTWTTTLVSVFTFLRLTLLLIFAGLGGTFFAWLWPRRDSLFFRREGHGNRSDALSVALTALGFLVAGLMILIALGLGIWILLWH